MAMDQRMAVHHDVGRDVAVLVEAFTGVIDGNDGRVVERRSRLGFAAKAFLEGRITWGDIAELIGSSLSVADCDKPLSVGDVVDSDHRAREWAKKRIVEMGKTR